MPSSIKSTAMQPIVQLATVQFWFSFIVSNDKSFEEARKGGLEQTTGHSIQAHSSETHQCGLYSTTFLKHTSKYCNTQWADANTTINPAVQ